MSFDVTQKTLQRLEWPRILDRLVGHTQTPAGRGIFSPESEACFASLILRSPASYESTVRIIPFALLYRTSSAIIAGSAAFPMYRTPIGLTVHKMCE